METSTLSSEDEYLNDLDQKLVFNNKTAKVERLPNAGGLGILKITRNPTEWSSTCLLKYSPPFFTLVSLTGSSLSIVTLTHNEETVEEVDFKVDLRQAPDEALVDFVSNSLQRQVGSSVALKFSTKSYVAGPVVPGSGGGEPSAVQLAVFPGPH